MKFSETLRRRIRHSRDGVDVVADINAAVAGNVGEPGRTSVSSRQTVVQRSGRTVTTTTHEKEARADEREA